MANRITHELNSIINNSSSIRAFFSKSYLTYLDSYTGMLDPDRVMECADVDMYYRVSGFELFDDLEKNADMVAQASEAILGSSATGGEPLSFTVYNKDKETKVFFGANHTIAPQVKSAITGNLRGATISNEWIKPLIFQQLQRCNGIITGLCTLSPGDIDTAINSITGEEYLLSFVFLPVLTEHVQKEILRINNLLDILQRVSKTDQTIGSSRARRFENDNHDVLEAINILNAEKTRLDKGLRSGLWTVAGFVSSSSSEGFYRIASAISSIFRRRSDVEKDTGCSRVTPITFSPYLNAKWQIPYDFVGERDLGGIYSGSLLNIAELKEAASLTYLPLFSHYGYSVRHYGDSAASAGAFDRYPTMPKTEGGQCAFGKLETGDTYIVPLNSMRQHVFVTGSTQYGKSTSIRKLLSESSRARVPFVVIESAKKEYWHLKEYAGMEDIRVLSNGMDSEQLFINPFQPEANTILDYHIQSLIQAFLSLFDQADPLPQILTELIYMSYEKRGWDVSRRVGSQNDIEYPTLQDLLDNLNECIDSIGYSQEISDNMRGVIRIRIASLIRQAGKALNTKNNISIEELYRSSAVIELDDFPDRNKPFVAALVAIKASEYSRNSQTGTSLKRLLVVEEAHHIIPNTELRSISPNAVLCSNYFANMLAEISAYGTGVVIIDQRPSAVSSAAIANTGMKIIHNLHDGDDVDRAAASLSLMSFEKTILPRLNIGEALIVLPQTNTVSRVRVNGTVGEKRKINLGSLFCRHINQSSIDLIGPFERNYLKSNGFSAITIKYCVDSIESRTPRNLSREDKLSIAGTIVSETELNDIQMRQLMYEITNLIDREAMYR